MGATPHLGSRRARSDQVAVAADGVNERMGAGPVDLSPQMTDVDVQQAVEPVDLGLPDVFAEDAAGDDLAGVSHQDLENRVFRPRETDWAVRAHDPVTSGVE